MGGVKEVSELYRALESDQHLRETVQTLVRLYKKKEKRTKIGIPLLLFSNKDLGILQITVKYLKENSSMSYSSIARLLKRNERTIWATYAHAKKKNGYSFNDSNESQLIPVDILADRRFGPLEGLVFYMRDELGMTFKEISGMLNRSYTTIWVSYQNAQKKSNN